MAAVIISLTLASVIAIGWASGIGRKHKEHPDYKDDFLNDDL
jgi:hypothetical protein